jgi:chorismate mutase
MSDFKLIDAIAADLRDAGAPLSPQQMIALKESRKKAIVKAREEIRNAVRSAMTSKGFGASELRQAAKDLTQEVVNNTLKERDVTTMIDVAVTKKIEAAFVKVDIVAIVRGQVEKEAAQLAQQYVRNNITVKADGGKYPHGGTF